MTNYQTRDVSLAGDFQAFEAEHSGLSFSDTTITSAQLLALNATAQTVVAAPGAGKALVFEWAILYMPYNSAAYAGVAAGEDLSFKMNTSAGTEVAQCEVTGFLDQTSSQCRHVRATGVATSGNTAVTQVENQPIVLHMLTGEITTGNSPLKVRVYYRVVPTTLP